MDGSLWIKLSCFSDSYILLMLSSDSCIDLFYGFEECPSVIKLYVIEPCTRTPFQPDKQTNSLSGSCMATVRILFENFFIHV